MHLHIRHYLHAFNDSNFLFVLHISFVGDEHGWDGFVRMTLCLSPISFVGCCLKRYIMNSMKMITYDWLFFCVRVMIMVAMMMKVTIAMMVILLVIIDCDGVVMIMIVLMISGIVIMMMVMMFRIMMV